MSDPRLARWLTALVATPGLTAIESLDEARRVHLAGSLALLPTIEAWPGPLVDVGSGGGSPGIPLAAAMPERPVTLLESNRRKAEFLERMTSTFANVTVVCGRAEEQPVDAFGVAVARALAPPPVAAEWCLPLVRPGGAVVLYVGKTADVSAVQRVSRQVGGGSAELADGAIVVPKIAPTPSGFPRRPGAARKRPLG